MKQIILLSGDDLYSQEEFEKKIIEEKIDPAWETFNLNILDGFTCSVDQLIESIDSPPFGLGAKLTVLKNAENILNQKDNITKPLQNVFDKGLMESNFLLIITSNLDKRKSFTKYIQKVAEVKEFAKPKPWEVSRKLFPYIEDNLRKLGKRIEIEALQELVEATGADKQRISLEIEKLLLYIGENNIITLKDVRVLVSNTEAGIFNLLDLLARREIGNALLEINNLLLREAAMKLLLSLSSNLKTVYNIKLLSEADMFYKDIAKELGQNPFLVDKNLKTWRHFNSKKLRKIMRNIFQLEVRFKSSAVDHKLEFEKFIISNFS